MGTNTKKSYTLNQIIFSMACIAVDEPDKKRRDKWDAAIKALKLYQEETHKAEIDKQKREDILNDSDERFDDGYWL